MRMLVAVVVAVLAMQPLAQAFACTPVRRTSALPLDQAWQGQFGEWFARAQGVYLVAVDEAGPLEGGPEPMPCDDDLPPPPPISGARGKAQRAEIREIERRHAVASQACSPGKARFHVVETLKGAPREDWVEETAFIQVVDGPPPEPIDKEAGFAVYGARVGSSSLASCGLGWFARRMSRQASYLVFTTEYDAPTGRLTHVFLADDRTPFLAQARRLARSAP